MGSGNSAVMTAFSRNVHFPPNTPGAMTRFGFPTRLFFVLAVALLLSLSAAPAHAQEADTLADRAEQRMKQLREQRNAERRARMQERRQEIQERIRRTAAPPAPSGVVEQDSLALVALYRAVSWFLFWPHGRRKSLR